MEKKQVAMVAVLIVVISLLGYKGMQYYQKAQDSVVIQGKCMPSQKSCPNGSCIDAHLSC